MTIFITVACRFGSQLHFFLYIARVSIFLNPNLIFLNQHKKSSMDFKKINFGYSMKNIAISPKHQYVKQFLAKMESFVKRSFLTVKSILF